MQVPPENIRWIGDDPVISQRTGNTGQGLGVNPSNAGRGRGSLRDKPENEVRPSQNGVVKKVWDEIEILHTDTLIEKVEHRDALAAEDNVHNICSLCL